MPEHVLMSGIEIINDGGRRRRWSSAEKLRIVEETLDGRESISVVARRNGVAPNLLYRWRRLMLEGGSVAVVGDDDVTSNRTVRQLEDRVRELERQLGRKTLEVEILKEALDKARSNKRPCLRSIALQAASVALVPCWPIRYHTDPAAGPQMRVEPAYGNMAGRPVAHANAMPVPLEAGVLRERGTAREYQRRTAQERCCHRPFQTRILAHRYLYRPMRYGPVALG